MIRIRTVITDFCTSLRLPSPIWDSEQHLIINARQGDMRDDLLTEIIAASGALRFTGASTIETVRDRSAHEPNGVVLIEQICGSARSPYRYLSEFPGRLVVIVGSRLRQRYGASYVDLSYPKQDSAAIRRL